MKQLVVCGGGNSAHTLIPLLNDSIFEVSIYTSRPEEWSETIELEWHNPNGEIMGKLLDNWKGRRLPDLSKSCYRGRKGKRNRWDSR